MVFLLVDKIPQKIPKLTKDIFWNNVVPTSLPFTKAAADYMMKGCPVPSTQNIKISDTEKEIIAPTELEVK